MFNSASVLAFLDSSRQEEQFKAFGIGNKSNLHIVQFKVKYCQMPGWKSNSGNKIYS